jgi:site-specific DNA recombinase
MFGNKEIAAAEWRAAREPIERRIKAQRSKLQALTHTDALAGLPGNGDQLRQQWAELNLTRQAAIVSAILDHAIIAPGQPGSRSVDPTRVRPVWRL